jgi:pimeloyl-ACP methyl ester carboxylesterase
LEQIQQHDTIGREIASRAKIEGKMVNKRSFVILLFAFAAWLVISLTGLTASAEIVLAKFGDVRLNGKLHLAPGKTLRDGVVLMVPSPLGHNGMEIIQTVQDLLNENEVNTLAITLSRGVDNRRGFVDCNEEHRPTAEDYFAEIDFWIEWLRKRGAGQVVLFAHSQAANYVTVYAARRTLPDITGLIILAPATRGYGEAAVKRYKIRYRVALSEVLARADQLIAAGKGAELMTETDFGLCPAASVTPNAFISRYRDIVSQDLPNLWSTSSKRILIIGGTADQIAPNVEIEATRASKSSNVKVIIIEDAGHYFRDLFADDAVEAMVGFISGN